MILIAQQQPKGAEAAGVAGAIVSILMCCGVGLFVGAILGLVIWHLISASKALAACSEDNRDMQPGQVYMFFIPAFGPIWHFFIILRVASSLEKEFDERGLDGDGGDFGKTLGLWALILNIVGCGMVGIVLLIVWTMKIRGYTQILTDGGNGGGKKRSNRRPRDDEDDDE